MSTPRVDITGSKYGRLTVIHQAGRSSTNGMVLWLCHCECGNQTVVHTQSLRKGRTRSCGCLRREAPRARGRFVTGVRL
jgi:hypothetical protein